MLTLTNNELYEKLTFMKSILDFYIGLDYTYYLYSPPTHKWWYCKSETNWESLNNLFTLIYIINNNKYCIIRVGKFHTCIDTLYGKIYEGRPLTDEMYSELSEYLSEFELLFEAGGGEEYVSE